MKFSKAKLIVLGVLAPAMVVAETQNVAPAPQTAAPQQYQQQPAGPLPGQAPPPGTPGAAAKGGSVLQRLQKKLSKESGEPVRLAVLEPLDYTGVKLGRNVRKILVRGMTRFAKVELIETAFQLDELTLESFRSAIINTNAEVLVVTVLKPNGFEIFLYDVRNPYVIYTYAHTLPDPRIHQYSKKVVLRHTKQLIARLLHNYVKEIYYELPRADRQLASFEGSLSPENVPRGPAATDLYFSANKDRVAKYYASSSVGFFLTKGANGMFNSSVLSGQFGWNFKGNLVAELTLDMATYNIGTLSLKKLGESELSQWRYLFGLGIGFATAKFTANWDQTDGIGFSSLYVVPSGTVFFPISHTAYLKAEARLYVGIPPSRVLFSFLPGLVVRF